MLANKVSKNVRCSLSDSAWILGCPIVFTVNSVFNILFRSLPLLFVGSVILKWAGFLPIWKNFLTFFRSYCNRQTRKFFSTLKKFYKKILHRFTEKVNDIACRFAVLLTALLAANLMSLDFTWHYKTPQAKLRCGKGLQTVGKKRRFRERSV